MKTKKLYQVRREMGFGSSTKQIGHKMKLVSRNQGLKIVRFLKKRGIDALIAPVNVAA